MIENGQTFTMLFLRYLKFFGKDSSLVLMCLVKILRFGILQIIIIVSYSYCFRHIILCCGTWQAWENIFADSSSIECEWARVREGKKEFSLMETTRYWIEALHSIALQTERIALHWEWKSFSLLSVRHLCRENIHTQKEKNN